MRAASKSGSPEGVDADAVPARVVAIMRMTAYLVSEAMAIDDSECQTLFLATLGLLCKRLNVSSTDHQAIMN